MDQFIHSSNIASYSFCYFHWEKQVVNQKFHDTWTDQLIHSSNIAPYNFCYFDWEKQVVDQRFYESWINSYILLTLPHTISGRNKMLIKFHDSWINSYILLTLPRTICFFHWEKQDIDQGLFLLLYKISVWQYIVETIRRINILLKSYFKIPLYPPYILRSC